MFPRAAPVFGLAKRATASSSSTPASVSVLVSVVANTRSYSAPVGNAIPPAKKMYVPTRGSYPQGFRVGGVVVGVKPNNTTKPDLAMIVSDVPCAAAAVFTKNKFQAAPVTFSRDLLKKSPQVQAVLINSGCANAVTGKGGLEDAAAMAAAADSATGGSGTIVMSTGVIGQRLPIQKILDGVPRVYAGLGSSHDHWLATAKAICTTDTFPKLISKTFTLPSSTTEYAIAGTTKGAGMIHPNMATLLGVVATDAPLAPAALAPLLKHAVDRSFNSITIDGDTSTNDTVALLANGVAGGKTVPNDAASPDYIAFQAVLTDFAAELAKLVVRDGEGATKFVTIRVTEAASELDARRIASTIAKSPLVKTALYGKDANWGRILCATGYSLISEPGEAEAATPSIEPTTTNVSFVPTDGTAELKLLVNGEPEAVDEKRAAEILELEDLEILVRLGTGQAEATYWTCDFSHEYVTINGDYRT